MDHQPAWNTGRHHDAPLGPAPCVHPTASIKNCDIGEWTEIGAYTNMVDSVLDDYSYVASYHSYIMYARIGKFTSIASHVRINPTNHPTDRVTQHHCTYRRRQYGFDDRDDDDIFKWRKAHTVHIGHDVWIGHGAIILPGVRVGNGAVVGAGAVVSKDVAAYHVVVGTPAYYIRTRFDSRTVAAFQAIRWWDWDHQTLKKRFQDLLNPNDFIAKYGSHISPAQSLKHGQ